MNELPAPRLPGLNRRRPAWLVPGRVLAGCSPALGKAGSLPLRLRALLDAGIDTFLDLTLFDEHHEALYHPALKVEAERRSLSIDILRHPLSAGDPQLNRSMQAALDDLDHAVQRGRSVYVHCWSGFGRTGLAGGCFLVRHGSSPAAALRWIQSLRAGMQGPPLVDPIPYSLVMQWKSGH